MNTHTPKNTLTKAEKLKSRKQIEALFATGKSFTAYPLKVVYKLVDRLQLTVDVRENEDNQIDGSPTNRSTVVGQPSSIQIGVTASSRHFKHAVDRNRIKRLLREAYRHQKHDLQKLAGEKGLCLMVFFIYLDKTLPTFEMLNDKMRYCLKRLRKTVEAMP